VASIDCNAIVTVIHPDMDSLKATYADPDLPAKLHPDEKTFTEDDRRMVLGKRSKCYGKGRETIQVDGNGRCSAAALLADMGNCRRGADSILDQQFSHLTTEYSSPQIIMPLST
jgi:hypothetical protein